MAQLTIATLVSTTLPASLVEHVNATSTGLVTTAQLTPTPTTRSTPAILNVAGALDPLSSTVSNAPNTEALTCITSVSVSHTGMEPTAAPTH